MKKIRHDVEGVGDNLNANHTFTALHYAPFVANERGVVKEEDVNIA